MFQVLWEAMKKIVIFIFINLAILVILAKPLSQSCDDWLEQRSESIVNELEGFGEVEFLKRLFLREKALPEEVGASECREYFGKDAGISCYGGNVLIATIEAAPFYCPLLGTGPATISVHYSAHGIPYEIRISKLRSFLNRVSDFKVRFGES